MGTAQKAQSTEAFIDKPLAENQALKDQIEVLKSAMTAPVRLPREWRLTRQEDTILRHLAKRDVVRNDSFAAALFSDQIDPPSYDCLKTYVFRLRAKLKPFGITITTVWGTGYALDDESRAKILALSKAAPA